MKRTIICFWVFLAITVNSQNTYEFLRLDMSPRVAALGGSFVSANDDPNIIFYNPAGLQSLTNTPVSVSFLKHVLDINYASVVMSQELEAIGRFGFAIKYADYGNFTQADEFGNRGADYGVRELAFVVGYANALESNFFYGTNLKLIYSSIGNYSSSAVAVDIGLHYYLTPANFSFGISATNIGTQLSTYASTREDLPLDITFGVSKKVEKLPVKLYLDFHKLNKKGGDFFARFSNFTFGAEFTLSKVLTLRLGYDKNRRDEVKIGSYSGLAGYNGGLGVKIKNYLFDYAYSSYGDFGALHRIGVSTEF